MLDRRRTLLNGIGHVELRVRRLEESAAFYCDLLGLHRRSTTPPSDRVCKCVGDSTTTPGEFSVILVEGLPPMTELAGLDHVSFRVPAENDVRHIHERAGEMGVRCTTPRILNGVYQFFVFDPDGYKLEIAAIRREVSGEPV